MPTPEEESRKLLCVCGKHHGTFTMQGLDIVCRHCKGTTTVPYLIKNLQEAKAFVQERRVLARRPKTGLPNVPKRRRKGVRESGH
jgi:hypothetical protein